MQAFRNRLAKRARHLRKWAKKEDVNAYRVYDRDMPEYPFQVDIYGDAAVVSVLKRRVSDDPKREDWNPTELATHVAEVLAFHTENVFVKERQHQHGKNQYEKQRERQWENVVVEYGLQFIVNLSDYLDTGLFLDHRPARKLLREMANGKRVLNLYGYTGSLSVAAAAGGARQVTTVDLSNTYLEWAKRNFVQNRLKTDQHRFERADALPFLRDAFRRRLRYDLIVVDPPSFSNSKKMQAGSFDVQRDHVELLVAAFALLETGGRMFFSTNRRGFQLDREMLERRCGRHLDMEDVTENTTPPDFARHPPHKAWWISP